MYPLPTPENLHMLQQLRDRKRLKCRAEQSDDDERDVEEVAEFLSAVVDTPLKPIHADATGTTQVGASPLVRNTHEKGNRVPIIRLGDKVSRRVPGNSRRKRALCEVEGSVDDANKAARTRKDSTAGKLRADTVEPDTTDSFHSILARHSYDRDTFDAFKSTISKCLFAELGDFVNWASDDEVDPFTGRVSELFCVPGPPVYTAHRLLLMTLPWWTKKRGAKTHWIVPLTRSLRSRVNL
ncbi:hypothetical protein FA13DRAFT_174361 [Coprinellus micaceus]|uniref:Uncharacterized protein n=1 Tax=Coprinellus micaceus TaxID=71717 RepID=A0A4Y7SGA0_COPMI|nr:hypothetical protein FA13DRAFT_174361 [Coprinellus micaceus]